MREIGKIPEETQARLFEDHLRAQGITAKLATGKEGWAVWVHNEDHVPRAAEELRTFLKDPEAPRYRESSLAAKAVNRAVEAAERAHRKNSRDLRDRWEAPAWAKYPFTLAMIVMSLAVGLLTDFGGHDRQPVMRALIFSDYAIGPHGEPTDRGFANIGEGQVWRLITPSFLHFGFRHFLFNMLALASFGGVIEFRKGTLRFIGLVIVTSIASNVCQYLADSRHPEFSIFGGMSGVGYALFGYLWVKGQNRPEERLGVSNQTVIMMIAWFILCTTGYAGPIANTAHGVGLATGMLIGLTRY